MTLTYLQSQTGNDTNLPAKSDGRVVTLTYLQSRADSHSGMNQAAGYTSLRSDRVWLDTGSPPTDKTRLARTDNRVTRDHKTRLASTGNTGYS